MKAQNVFILGPKKLIQARKEAQDHFQGEDTKPDSDLFIVSPRVSDKSSLTWARISVETKSSRKRDYRLD